MNKDHPSVLRNVGKFFRENPDKWSQGFFCRDETGKGMKMEMSGSSKARCWCMLGRIYHDSPDTYFDIEGAIACYMQENKYVGIANWNDYTARHASDVANLCDEIASWIENQRPIYVGK